ncbi:MAG: hypothetical protein CMF60_06805 [Magnetococcales bacterium]|nr:hypothetical protein [Magnetococcales bacterium]|tara:strand:+ start:6800 stop:7561 length:762 start_codon:yes stop_codon:yes gene_type:complete
MIDFLWQQLYQFSHLEWLLIAVSFFTSLLTVVAGIGGGVLLLAVMLSVFPPAVVLPVHGVVQLGSNFFRALLLRRFLSWSVFVPFIAGSALGALAGAHVYVALPEAVLKLILALFILHLVWLPKLGKVSLLSLRLRSIVGGFLSTMASLFVGASGPLAAAFIQRSTAKKEGYIATHAAAMVAQHGFKSVAFGFLGFAFYDYALLMILMIATGFLGTFLGKRVLLRLPESLFEVIYKTVISLVAVKLLYEGLFV